MVAGIVPLSDFKLRRSNVGDGRRVVMQLNRGGSKSSAVIFFYFFYLFITRV